jgi:hypothetical protein
MGSGCIDPLTVLVILHDCEQYSHNLLSSRFTLHIRIAPMIQFSSLRPIQSAALLMSLLAGWGALSPAAQAAVKFTKIFQSGEPAPGSQSQFSPGNTSTPAISGSKVAFSAQFPNEPIPAGAISYPFSVYKFSNGKLEKQLDSMTPVPNGPNERFGGLSLGKISLQGDQVIASYFAVDSTLYQRFGLPVPKIKGGVYGFQNGKVSVIADTETMAPDGQKFSGFGFARYQGPTGSWGVSASANQVVFGATTPSTLGLYRFRNGQISALIDENTINPTNSTKLGLGAFQYQFNPYAAAVDQFDVNGAQIAFLPAVSPSGNGPLTNPYAVFSVQPQKLTSLVTSNDPLPGTSAKSPYFASASISGNGALTFVNIVPGPNVGVGDRVLLKQGNQIRSVYTVGQPVDGLRTPADSVRYTCISGTQVTFLVNSNRQYYGSALLVSRGGKISPLVQAGDQLNGKTVRAIDPGTQRYCSGRFFVFDATFTDGSTGMYRGEIIPDMNALIAGQPDPSDE